MRRYLDDPRRTSLPGSSEEIALDKLYPMQVWQEITRDWLTPVNPPPKVLHFPLGYKWRVGQ